MIAILDRLKSEKQGSEEGDEEVLETSNNSLEEDDDDDNWDDGVIYIR